MGFPPLVLLRDEFKFTTWLLAGAFLQGLLTLLYPSRLSALPSLIAILYLVSQNSLLRYSMSRDPKLGYKDVRLGRTTAQIVEDDGSVSKKGCDKGIVIFLLGARSNHMADGRRAEGFAEVGSMFGDMWKDLYNDREKWGFLGKTSTLLASDAENTNTLAWISYWKSLDHLHAFARADSHRKGWDWYIKRNPAHIGIMHETYVVPAGNWETIYHNFTPFGLGQTKQAFADAESKNGERALASGLIEAKGPTWNSMKTRMKKLAKETQPQE